MDIAAAANEHLPLCAQHIVDETCQAGHSALELVSESTGSSQEAVLPFLESLGLSRDSSCRAVCGAVVDAIPASSLPRRSDEGCRYDFEKSGVACDVSFLAIDSEVQRSQAPAKGDAEGLPPHRPVRAGRKAQAGTRPRAPALSRGEILLEVANRFRIYPYRFPETAAEGALLEAHPQVFAPGYASYAGRAGYAGYPGYSGYGGAQMPQPQVYQPQMHHQQQAYQPQVQWPQAHQPQVQQPQMPQPHLPPPQMPSAGTPLYHHLHQHPGSASSAHHSHGEGHHTGSAPVRAPSEEEQGVHCPACEGNQRRKLEETRALAQAMMASALRAMQQGKHTVAQSMRTYFGVDNKDARKKIMDILRQVNIMVNGKLLYDPTEDECDSGTIAWVYPEEMTEDETMHIIHVCKGFFQGLDFGNLQGITKAGRAGVRAYTVIHELTHHLGAEDVCARGEDEPCSRTGVAYGGAMVRLLAAVKPMRALENADSIALFAQSLHGTFW